METMALAAGMKLESENKTPVYRPGWRAEAGADVARDGAPAKSGAGLADAVHPGKPLRGTEFSRTWSLPRISLAHPSGLRCRGAISNDVPTFRRPPWTRKSVKSAPRTSIRGSIGAARCRRWGSWGWISRSGSITGACTATGCRASSRPWRNPTSGALLVFDVNNIRYIYVDQDRRVGARQALALGAAHPHRPEPILWDFGSAAVHHKLYTPCLATENCKAGPDRPRAAPSIRPSGLMKRHAEEIASLIREAGVADMPIGVGTSSKPPMMFEVQKAGLKVALTVSR